MTFGLPPRMAATDELGDRACLWRADVIAMHSEMTSDTGSTATDTGRLLYCMREEVRGVRRERDVVPGDMRAGSMMGTGRASRFILRVAGW